MKINTKTIAPKTFGGAKASIISPKEQLRRSVLTCLLWEDQHYEDGQEISKRIAELVPLVDTHDVAELAVEAREKMKLRHVPLYLCALMAASTKHRGTVKDTLARVVQRPDELGEFLSLYWKGKRSPIASGVKKGLAAAFLKFNEYQFAKWNKDAKIKLRDVMFLCHPKPRDEVQTELFRKIANDELRTPDTWEVALSGGANKAETFIRLIEEGTLGGMALLKNLRGMIDAKVPLDVVNHGLDVMKTGRILPFRFISAAKYAPQVEGAVERAMLRSLEGAQKLPGRTILVVDVSGSMQASLGSKSEMSRLQAAASVAILARELCEDAAIYVTAGNDHTRVHKTSPVPARRGFALSDTIANSMRIMGGGGIFLTQCLTAIQDFETKADRVIVFTDEVDCDDKLSPDKAPLVGRHNYIVNIASAKNGIAYSKFTHINGWSEAIFDFIGSYESNQISGS